MAQYTFHTTMSEAYVWGKYASEIQTDRFYLMVITNMDTFAVQTVQVSTGKHTEHHHQHPPPSPEYIFW